MYNLFLIIFLSPLQLHYFQCCLEKAQLLARKPSGIILGLTQRSPIGFNDFGGVETF